MKIFPDETKWKVDLELDDHEGVTNKVRWLGSVDETSGRPSKR